MTASYIKRTVRRYEEFFPWSRKCFIAYVVAFGHESKHRNKCSLTEYRVNHNLPGNPR